MDREVKKIALKASALCFFDRLVAFNEYDVSVFLMRLMCRSNLITYNVAARFAAMFPKKYDVPSKVLLLP